MAADWWPPPASRACSAKCAYGTGRRPAGCACFRGIQDSLYAAALGPDGKQLSSSSYDQQIKIWDAAKGTELQSLSGHNDAVYDLAYRPDGKLLASASGDRTVKLWDVASGERLDTFGQPLKEQYCRGFQSRRHPAWPRAAPIAASASGRSAPKARKTPIRFSTRALLTTARCSAGLFAGRQDAGFGGRGSRGQDLGAPTMVERLELEQQPDWADALAVSPDGKSIAVGRLDGTLAFYETAEGKLIPAPPAPKPELSPLALRGGNRARPAG